MQLKDIAINNLRRRKTKIIFLVFGMVFAITTIVSLFSISSAMKNEVEKKFNEVGTRLAITPKTDTKDITYGGITIPNAKVSFNIKELKESDLKDIKNIKDADKIQLIAPKVLGGAVVDGRKLALVGIDFAVEKKLKSYWSIVGREPQNDNEVVLGGDVAMKLKKQPGQIINIKDHPFKIVGVLDNTGTEEDKLLFANLPAVQKTFNKEGKLSFVEISVARETDAVKNVTQEIAAKLPDAKINSPQKAVEERKDVVDRFGKFAMIISVVMLIIGALIVLTTMMSSVNERTREIGIFRAIGFRKSHIMKIILLEAGITSGISGLIGYVTGIVIAIFVAPVVAQMKVSVSINPLFALLVIILSIGVGLLATIYPASKAAKLDPSESLRYI